MENDKCYCLRKLLIVFILLWWIFLQAKMPFDANKLYCSEILAILLQNNDSKFATNVLVTFLSLYCSLGICVILWSLSWESDRHIEKHCKYLHSYIF